MTVALDREDRHDLEGMLREITVATRLVIVCNPNNPTSTALPLEQIARFLAEVPRHVCVVLDEAYCEFNLLNDPEESVELLEPHPNLVLLRTFSKVYGLCGLRVGFALCGSEELPRAVDQVRQPFFCNALAQAAAVEALAHQDVVEERVTKTIAERVAMDEGLRALGLSPAESQANFCWFELGADREERAVMDGLAERGVLVRGGADLGREGAPAGHLRYAGGERALPRGPRRSPVGRPPERRRAASRTTSVSPLPASEPAPGGRGSATTRAESHGHLRERIHLARASLAVAFLLRLRLAI